MTSTLRDVPLERADNLADRLTDIENRVTADLINAGLVGSPEDKDTDTSAFPMQLDEVVANVSPCDGITADVEIRWSKLRIAGWPIGRRVLARQLRAFADSLEGLDCNL